MGELNLKNFGGPTPEEMKNADLKKQAMERIARETTGLEVKEGKKNFEVNARTGVLQEAESMKDKLANAGLEDKK